MGESQETYGQTEGWAEGRTDGRMGGRAEGRKDGQTLFYRTLPAEAGSKINKLKNPNVKVAQMKYFSSNHSHFEFNWSQKLTRCRYGILCTLSPLCEG